MGSYQFSQKASTIIKTEETTHLNNFSMKTELEIKIANLRTHFKILVTMGKKYDLNLQIN